MLAHLKTTGIKFLRTLGLLLTSLCASITPLHSQIVYLTNTPSFPHRISRKIFQNVFVQILEKKRCRNYGSV